MQLTTTNATPIISHGLTCLHCHEHAAIVQVMVDDWGNGSGLSLPLCALCVQLPARVLSQAQLGDGRRPGEDAKP